MSIKEYEVTEGLCYQCGMRVEYTATGGAEFHESQQQGRLKKCKGVGQGVRRHLETRTRRYVSYDAKQEVATNIIRPHWWTDNDGTKGKTRGTG